jgi:hypothetical protein
VHTPIVCTRWFKYDRDWFLCKQAALCSICATLIIMVFFFLNQSRSYLNHLVIPLTLSEIENREFSAQCYNHLRQRVSPTSYEQKCIIFRACIKHKSFLTHNFNLNILIKQNVAKCFATKIIVIQCTIKSHV